MRILQIIVWHFRAQVMNMMETDISAHPLQDTGKLVIRAAFNGCFHVAPLIIMFKIRILELMLDVEQPNAEKS